MYKKGNGHARPVVERGASLAHRSKLTKSQRAVLGADIFDGVRRYQPTQTDLATLLGISTTMIVSARRLSPAARQQIMTGLATLGHYAGRVPKPAIIKRVAASDDLLRKIIATRGDDHVVDIAAAMEAAE
jgi:hypothetical protein